MEAIHVLNKRISHFESNFESTTVSKKIFSSNNNQNNKSTGSSLRKNNKKHSTYNANSNYLEETTNSNSFRPEKYLKIARTKKLIKITDTLTAILGILGLFFSIVEYELFYDDTNKERYTSTTQCEALRAIVSISTGVIVFLLGVHSVFAYRLSREEREAEEETKYFKSGYFKQFLIEGFVMGIHSPPNYDQIYIVNQLDSEVVYSLDGFLMVWMLLRFYLVFRLFAQYSKWTNELAVECCEKEGCEANTLFAMKSVLKEKPFTSLLVLMTVSAVILGLAVRHFERPFYYGWSVERMNSTEFQDYSYIWNGMWLIMITMMTIGYGDFFPKTHMGRFICILACFWGVFLVSMMVVTLTVVSSFDEKQKKAYDILFRLNVKTILRKKASFVVTIVIRLISLKNKYKKNKVNKDEYFKDNIKLNAKLEMSLQYFRDVRSQITEYEISSEESLRQLTEKIDRDLDEVKEVLLSLIEMEKQLNEIEQSQSIVAIALNECISFTNHLEDHLNMFKQKLIDKLQDNEKKSFKSIEKLAIIETNGKKKDKKNSTSTSGGVVAYKLFDFDLEGSIDRKNWNNNNTSPSKN